MRGKPGCGPQSAAGSQSARGQPCLPALLGAFPIAQHHRLQIPQRKKGTVAKYKKRRSKMESLKTSYSLAKTKSKEKATTKQLIEKLLAGQAGVLLLSLMINDNRDSQRCTAG